MNKMFAWFSVSVILLLQIYETEAACDLSGATCDMLCTNLNSENLKTAIEQRTGGPVGEWCLQAGLYLKLSSIHFRNNTIESKFFTANVKVIKLDVDLRTIEDVEADAFVSNALGTVKELKITNLGIKELDYDTGRFDVIRRGIFNGFMRLEILSIQSAGGIGIIEDGVLDSLYELKKFTFLQLAPKNEEINIKGFTGSETLANLEYVRFKYKLANYISDETFVGLTTVKTLDLSECQIESISSNSFEPLRNSIQEINLKSNLLTTIEAGLFDILPKSGLTIDISSNPFHCDCELIYLRSILEQFVSHFNGSVVCSTLDMTSENCISRNVLESQCFDDCGDEEPSTTEYATTTTTTQTTTLNPDEYFTKECYKPNESQLSDVVSVKHASSYMTITETSSGEVNLNIDSQYSSSVVIWFNGNQESVDDINCISLEDRTSIPITDLVDNVIYSFCVMDKTQSIVSALNCMSYTKRESVWLYSSSKTLTVTLIVIVLMLNILLGIGIGFWILNYSPFAKIENRNTSHLPIKLKFPLTNNDGADRNSNIKSSYMTNNITRTSLPNDTSVFSAPPLPERPPNMQVFEEPAYATVEYIDKNK